MFAASEPIGRFVVFANLQKDVISKFSIEQDIENLIDLIKIRINNKTIQEVSESLLSNVFDLRFEVFEWLASNNKSIGDYFGLLNDLIATNLQLAAYSELANTISIVLQEYEKITSPLVGKLEEGTFKGLLENIQDNKPNYDTVRLLSLHPSPQIKFLKNWIDASLRLEIGLILSDLILTQQIKFAKKRIKEELVKFLLDTINRFGAYSIFTGFWKPEETDISKLTNKMQILAATIELDHKVYFKTSKEGFLKLINN